MSGRLGFAAIICFLAASCQLGAFRSSAPDYLKIDPGWVVVPGVNLIHQNGRSDCGAAALATVIKYWKPDTSPSSVEQALGPVDNQSGIEAGRLRLVALAHGLKAFLIEGTVEDLVHELQRRRPVILGLVTTKDGHPAGHYEIVVGVNVNRKLFLLADPRGAWHEIGADKLLQHWRPSKQLALVIFP